ncbi:murein hydrolase activator EnvC family protein [Streptomyces sp. NPDC002667]|uniref:murein hydrolase activator EnvC family protein n=1 Tax=Streptomyces sp. NPDC002667 TaxID=3364657 RepID=UPI0036AC19D7
MRVNRCARIRRGLLLCLILTVLGTPAPSALARAPSPAPRAPASPPAADPSVPAVARLWPVGVRPFVLRDWEPPATAYSRGHRGVDLAAMPGDPVRAVAPGRVSFAGRVGGRGVVSVELSGTGTPPLRTTYGPVRASARKGDEVLAGQVLGTLEAADKHCVPASCLHWGLLRGTVYLNPLSLLPARLLHTGPSRLLPLDGTGPRSRVGRKPAGLSPGRPGGPSSRPPP